MCCGVAGVLQYCDVMCVVVQLECCGASGPQDYQMSTWFNLTRHSDGLFVPYSCCVMLDNTVPRPVPVKAHKCQHEALLYRPDHHLDWDFLHVRVRYHADTLGLQDCVIILMQENQTLKVHRFMILLFVDCIIFMVWK